MQMHLKKIQRLLRNDMPLSEQLLWKRIRRNELGVRFRRQYVHDRRIFDFYAPSVKLAIEVDGSSHFENSSQRESELLSDEMLALEGIRVARFLNTEVQQNIDEVVEEILHKIRS